MSPSARPLSHSASIAAAFLAAAERSPDKPCLLFEGERITYAQLRDQALRWAAALRAWGLRPQERVALYLENSPTFLASYLGTHLASGIVVLVNTQYRQVELRHILSDSAARLCLTDAAGQAELARVSHELTALEQVIVADTAASFLAVAQPAELPPPNPDDVAVLAYTSGTTGRAKGAMLTHANLVANSAAVTQAWRWSADDTLLLALPLFHVHGLCVGMHGTWLLGANAELHRRFDATAIYDRLLADGRPQPGQGHGEGQVQAHRHHQGHDQGRITMFFGVPTMYTRLIAEAERRLAAGEPLPAPLRLYVSGSAPLSVHTFETFERLFGQRILERYGMSETIMNLTNPYDGERRPGTVGMPFPGQQARIVDVRTRAPIHHETPGEIQVRGPHVFKGYWQRPDATADAFADDGWFNTGDLGWRSADGYFTISGRARELIITGGYNVYPREVEEVLQTHPAVAEAAVLGLPDSEFGEQIAAAVVLEPGVTATAATAEQLVDHCRDQLASYKKPRRIFFVESLPRNAMGKIQKHVLKEQLDHQA
ncbi:MAG: Long-chain-fatty-acid--CoA ligase [uncultured Chloroflexi bacterium]|uniref:Long-chain-fatty-acid--CoA ligase n=1 Tax=uncultured Chloroflexota bacterium TaxID=166587 RepID=A0A6J4ICQ5_9CHLR|nr:MAG: Long-chain-fatty-acid--CoA ligase [uncultured Chloroflexota bacterium]